MGTGLEGSTIGRFRVGRLLGRGGMGAVYAAFDEHLERDVALKVLHDEGKAGLANQKKRLMREARIAAKLQHPNIATIYEVEELEGNLFIVMELLEGQPLRRALHERKFGVAEAIEIARDMARGLARAHAAGFIHRDIKPENVFLTALSVDVTLTKILDFGLARQKPAEASARDERTGTGVSLSGVWGTPGYVSPEQALGQHVDVRTDLFSFGVVFYEMLANIRPFRGETAVATMIATARVDERPLREIVPDLPAEIDAIVARCLKKRPEDRFADGGELSAALEAFARGGAPALRASAASQPSLPLQNPELTTGSAALSLTTREDTLLAIENHRRDRMKLAALVGVGLALGLTVLVLSVSFAASRTRFIGASGTVVVASDPPPPPAPDPVIEPAPALDVPEPVPAPTPRPVPPSVPPPRPPVMLGGKKKPADCINPFIVDAKGVRIPKRYCL